MATGRPTHFKWQHRGSVTHSTLLHKIMRSKLVSFRKKWLTVDALWHAKFANHHCWFDALALIMQTGYEVSSLSVPVISHINDWAGYIGVATPFFICSRGSSTPFYNGKG